ncbi:MAG: OmpA family protein [Acidimicrobiales bacterium]|nr:OmpA family protein [Acidimicrobiales bacterium]
MRDPRDRRGRRGRRMGPGFGAGRRHGGTRGHGPPRRSRLTELVAERRTLLLVVLLIGFFVVVAIGGTGSEGPVDEQQDLSSQVQAAMVRAGLPTVEVQVVDWTVVLRGRLASDDLKLAATRVAQAQSSVVGVENLIVVPAPIVEEVVPEDESPDLPANQADLLLQARLSAAAARTPIQFGSGGDRITEDSVPTLELIAEFLVANPSVRVQIIGHTDSDGEEDANLTLSRIRAEAVRAQLIARGVEAERLTPLGMGEYDPVADNVTREGKARNRRIEFLVLPEGQEGLSAPTTTAPVEEEASTTDG